jgi:hypothetical protein
MGVKSYWFNFGFNILAPQNSTSPIGPTIKEIITFYARYSMSTNVGYLGFKRMQLTR